MAVYFVSEREAGSERVSGSGSVAHQRWRRRGFNHGCLAIDRGGSEFRISHRKSKSSGFGCNATRQYGWMECQRIKLGGEYTESGRSEHIYSAARRCLSKIAA